MTERTTLPTIRGDRAGYVLDGRSIDGFDDRLDIGSRARLILAQMAQRYLPKSLSNAQRALLDEAQGRSLKPSPRLVALTRNLEDLEEAYKAGLFADLDDDDVAIVRDPSTHPEMPGVRYPLTIGQAAKATGASTVQLRRWAEARLIPAVRIQGHLHFLGAGLLHAMLLVKTEKYEVSALMRILRGGEEGERLVRLLGVTLASISRELDDNDGAGDELALASATLIKQSKTVREAAEMYSAKIDDTAYGIQDRQDTANDAISASRDVADAA